jgi:hypothetical protein
MTETHPPLAQWAIETLRDVLEAQTGQVIPEDLVHAETLTREQQTSLGAPIGTRQLTAIEAKLEDRDFLGTVRVDIGHAWQSLRGGVRRKLTGTLQVAGSCRAQPGGKGWSVHYGQRRYKVHPTDTLASVTNARRGMAAIVAQTLAKLAALADDHEAANANRRQRDDRLVSLRELAPDATWTTPDPWDRADRLDAAQERAHVSVTNAGDPHHETADLIVRGIPAEDAVRLLAQLAGTHPAPRQRSPRS